MKERERVKVDFDYYVRNVRSLKAKANPNPRKLGEVRVVSNTHNTYRHPALARHRRRMCLMIVHTSLAPL